MGIADPLRELMLGYLFSRGGIPNDLRPGEGIPLSVSHGLAWTCDGGTSLTLLQRADKRL